MLVLVAYLVFVRIVYSHLMLFREFANPVRVLVIGSWPFERAFVIIGTTSAHHVARGHLSCALRAR